MADLLPCPFCGKAQAERRTHDKYAAAGKIMHRVKCCFCDAGTAWFDRADKAHQAWNRRQHLARTLLSTTKEEGHAK